jgi:hypothetical protein
VWLHMNLARGGSAGQLVSGSREAPVPISLTVVALLAPALPPACPCGCTEDVERTPDPVGADPTPSIAGMLYDWIWRVLDDRPRFAGPNTYTVDRMTVWLIAQLDWITEQDWVWAFAQDLDRLHSVINATAPRWPRKEEPRPVPCSGCGLLALMWRPPYVECDARLGGCSRLYLASEYDDLVAQWVVWTQGQQEVAV